MEENIKKQQMINFRSSKLKLSYLEYLKSKQFAYYSEDD